MSNEVFNIVCENENLITDEETKILPELATDYENQETNVRGIISRFDSFMKWCLIQMIRMNRIESFNVF